MKKILLYHLFKALKGEHSFQQMGIDEYLQLQYLIAEPVFITSFEDFMYACEVFLVKDEMQRAVFSKVFQHWRTELEAYIASQFTSLDLMIKTDTLQVEPEVITGAAREGIQNIPETRPLPVAPALEKPVIKEPDTNAMLPPITDEEQTGDEQEDALISFSIGRQDGEEEKKGQQLNWQPEAAVSQTFKTFLFGNEYFPIGNRCLIQSWRSLKSRQQTNQYGGINLKATIRSIANNGMFTDFVLERVNQNLLSLFIIVDKGGSMAAYEAFANEIIATARLSGAHPDATALYCRNLPEQTKEGDYVVFNEDQTQAWTLRGLFGKSNKKDIVLLIYSDGGALRVYPDEVKEKRVDKTAQFLRFLVTNTAYAVWLNPVPKTRWVGTPAKEISKLIPEVPMFEATARGMEQAIHVLKGKAYNYS